MTTDPRLAYRTLSNAINLAFAATVAYFFPDIPSSLVAIWVGVIAGSLGLGEIWYDHRGASAP